MKNRKYLWFSLVLMLGFSSCEQDALVDPPEFKKQPVFMCLMTPKANVIQASAAYTKPYYGVQTEEIDFIENAILVLRDNESSNMAGDTFKYTQKGEYILAPKNVVIREKATYTLTAYLPNGQEFFAQSTTPPSADISKLEVTYVKVGNTQKDEWGYESNPFTVQFAYEGSDDERFYISPQFEGYAKNKTGDEIATNIFFSEEILPFKRNQVTEFLSRSFFYSGFGYEGPWSLDSFSGSVYTMDKAYRDFYLSQYQDDVTPFTEPTMFKSNFSEGALGVFGCYDYDRGTLVYPK